MGSKTSISFVDLYYWLIENKDFIVDSKLDNVKHKENNFAFSFVKNRKRYHLTVSLPNFLYIDDRAIKTDKFPSNFCMQLRKYLRGKHVLSIEQYQNERILEINFDNYVLIIEFIPPGNVVLVDSLERKIITSLYKHEWKDRKIFPGEIYRYPPRVFSLFNKSVLDLQKIFSNIEKEIVRFLAKECGFSGLYAEEICFLAKVDKNKLVKELTQGEIDRIVNTTNRIMNKEIDPRIYLEGNEIVSFSPFEIKHFSDKKKLKMNTFNDAIKTYAKNFQEKIDEKKIKRLEEKQKKIREQQITKLNELLERESNYRKIGELIYQHYAEISSLLNEIVSLRESKMKWKDIESRIRSEYQIVKKIEYRKGKVIVSLDGVEFELDFRKSIDENASEYFNKAKKLKEKIKTLEKIIKEPIKLPEDKHSLRKKPLVKQRTAWYEKFRYFFSSNGFLIVSGKDAETNELLIRKYIGKYDLILHADIHGSPFTVIKNDKKVIPLPPETIYEAAQFTAVYSRAWKLKLGSIHVYYFTPDQIVKQGGLPKGSFIIKGKKGWLEKIKLRLSIGIVVSEQYDSIEIVYGPPGIVKKRTPYLITLLPGDKKGNELVKEIKIELARKVPVEVRDLVENIPDDKILEIIPYGEGDLVR